MTEATRRERLRAHTERDIRAAARRLLVENGRDAVTLRAIARDLGITAPALYRYYDSREDLLRQLCEDVCLSMAEELQPKLDAVGDGDLLGQVFTVFRSFRRWALDHPQEFTLVFASPEVEVNNSSRGGRKTLGEDMFGRVFLGVAGKLLAENQELAAGTGEVPAALEEDLRGYRDDLLKSLADTGIQLTADRLGLSTVYLMLQCWVRLYGHVALEVFGRFPFALNNAETLFESMIAELAREVGLPEPPP
ncbi:TetR/AcrR family transcriptional regulator [Crossiella sp. CA-258035]|uniref:TetR/AcrR family transcriptional regulator n=1 Tax=Crossiella sp. CA-258035 TaxID=2981138 RepID=UPI0024BC8FD3|nr:TetR/AcrR family transcriptional regulator [Crossiella sp. CA-258035]WHT19493.1 TetR/AcrR family transcriptional regulator [Crossiella sp. CA-258035]